MHVDKKTVANWEKGKTEPPMTLMPKVLAFLGYDPLPVPGTLPERMLAYRQKHGLTTRAAADRLGVDQGSWIRWEQGERTPWPRFANRLAALLAS